MTIPFTILLLLCALPLPLPPTAVITITGQNNLPCVETPSPQQ